MEGFSLRKEIDRLIAIDAATEASMLLGQLWREEAGPSAAAFVVPRFEKLRGRLPFVSNRLFILRSFTLEPVVPLLRAEAFVGGIDLIVEVGKFNAYVQEILDPTSRLHRVVPDTVILAVQTRDVAPDLWGWYADLSSAQVEAAVDRISDDFRNWLHAFRSISKAHLILHNLEVPVFPSLGVLDSQSTTGQVAAIRQINERLCRLAREHTGAYVLDYDALVARSGRERWHDERKWQTMRMPVAADSLIHMAAEWLRFIHPLSGKVCKALVTDLDNTLWGGVIGEDGIEGIKIGQEYPGTAYHALQRAMLDLHHRGVILTVCSRNNLSDAMEALENHPGMVLRPHHFAALRINWNEKVQSIREIAAELNIAVEALAFLDDNPVEQQRVRVEMPEVTVIGLPADPMGYARALRESPVFERLTLSSEDRERGRYYVEQRQRAELVRSAGSLEDFYRSLRQEVEIVPLAPDTLARVAQLTQKTNQFNLTTRRYSAQRLAEMAREPDWRVYSLRVRDRFGDNGVVGVAILHLIGETCEIDTFLLSCRVIGRTVESALLSFLAKQARDAGFGQLRGWFFPTEKNAPARDFYEHHGFTSLGTMEGGFLWSLDIASTIPASPEWIVLKCVERSER
jgi:FkbH-like protein